MRGEEEEMNAMLKKELEKIEEEIAKREGDPPKYVGQI